MSQSTDSPAPLFFWREFEPETGYLSQWYKAPFVVDGVCYHSAEMWMMIQKARLFGDEETAQKMMATKKPSEHQALGRQAKGFDRGKWDEHKSRIVEEGNYHKFTKTKEELGLVQKLLDTGERELVEASPKDNIWGIGFSAEHAMYHKEDWGENRLGKAIVNVRQRLREEGYPRTAAKPDAAAITRHPPKANA